MAMKGVAHDHRFVKNENARFRCRWFWCRCPICYSSTRGIRHPAVLSLSLGVLMRKVRHEHACRGFFSPAHHNLLFVFADIKQAVAPVVSLSSSNSYSFRTELLKQHAAFVPTSVVPLFQKTAPENATPVSPCVPGGIPSSTCYRQSVTIASPKSLLPLMSSSRKMTFCPS